MKYNLVLDRETRLMLIPLTPFLELRFTAAHQCQLFHKTDEEGGELQLAPAKASNLEDSIFKELRARLSEGKEGEVDSSICASLLEDIMLGTSSTARSLVSSLVLSVGDAMAQYGLALFYDEGLGVERNPTKAAQYYRLAADQGLACAQYSLAYCYQTGEGIARNLDKAIEYYQLAADQGLAGAQHNLACCYQTGEGIARNLDKAIEYYQLAADQGLAIAQYNLAYCYHHESELTGNQSKAIEYYMLSACTGHKDSLVMLKKYMGIDNKIKLAFDEAVKSSSPMKNVTRLIKNKIFQKGLPKGDELNSKKVWFALMASYIAVEPMLPANCNALSGLCQALTKNDNARARAILFSSFQKAPSNVSADTDLTGLLYCQDQVVGLLKAYIKITGQTPPIELVQVLSRVFPHPVHKQEGAEAGSAASEVPIALCDPEKLLVFLRVLAHKPEFTRVDLRRTCLLFNIEEDGSILEKNRIWGSAGLSARSESCSAGKEVEIELTEINATCR